MKVLITGANGFVGRAAINTLQQAGYQTIQVVRSSPASNQLEIGTIDSKTDWNYVLAGCDSVLHLAARTHVIQDREKDPLQVYREINTLGTLNLARQAAAMGVRRFVFVSSIKVCGEHTKPLQPFRHDCSPSPGDPYGVSKLEAEVGLYGISDTTGMEVIIVRPPLIYGPDAKGNFAAMIRAVKLGFPLPFGRVTHNLRSLVALDNLVDLLKTCLEHPPVGNQTFLVSDGEDLSTSDLFRRLGNAAGKSTYLFPVPMVLLHAVSKVFRKTNMANRLFGNLQLDISYTCNTLGWRPPISIEEGLRRALKVSHL